MPLLRFDLIEGRSDAEMKSLLDASHEAVVEVFGVPVRDRYQVVNEHKASRLIVEDTGLGIPRTDKVVVLQMTSRPRGGARRRRPSTRCSARSSRPNAASRRPMSW